MDDTAQIQDLIDAAAGGPVLLDWHANNIYEFTTLRMKRGVTLKGKGRECTLLRKIGSAPNGIDTAGVGGWRLADMRIENLDDAPTQCLLLMGQKAGEYSADKIHLDNVRLDGRCSLATAFALSVCSSLATFAEFYSYTGSPAFTLTGQNFWGAASEHVTLDNAGTVPSDITFVQCEFHNLGGAFGNLGPGGVACWIGGAQSCRWMGGNMSANAGSRIMTVNAAEVAPGNVVHPNRLLFLGTTFYTDDGTVFPANPAGWDPSIPRGLEFNGVSLASCRFVEC